MRIRLVVGSSCIEIENNKIMLHSPHVSFELPDCQHETGLVRVGDQHHCPAQTGSQPHLGGPVTSGSSDVLVNGRASVRLYDSAACVGAKDSVQQGCSSLLINQLPAATYYSSTMHGGGISQAAENTTISPQKVERLSYSDVNSEPTKVRYFLQVKTLKNRKLICHPSDVTFHTKAGEHLIKLPSELIESNDRIVYLAVPSDEEHSENESQEQLLEQSLFKIDQLFTGKINASKNNTSN